MYIKNQKVQTISRPLQLLYPMEINDRHQRITAEDTNATAEKNENSDDHKIRTEGVDDQDIKNIHDSDEKIKEVPLRSRRTTAADGQFRRRLMKQT